MLYAFFGADGGLDRDAMRRQVHACVANGAHGLAVLGLATEVAKLSGSERHQMVEWGAKTIPEGGYHSVPERRHGDGLIIVGDAAGYVEVSSLKGIHYAMHSGILAARQIFEALKLDFAKKGRVQ